MTGSDLVTRRNVAVGIAADHRPGLEQVIRDRAHPSCSLSSDVRSVAQTSPSRGDPERLFMAAM